MTDDEADRWFTNHAEYEHRDSIGYTTFGLRKRGGNPEEVVGFVKGNAGDPDPALVRRFLVRWWVGLYGE